MSQYMLNFDSCEEKNSINKHKKFTNFMNKVSKTLNVRRVEKKFRIQEKILITNMINFPEFLMRLSFVLDIWLETKAFNHKLHETILLLQFIIQIIQDLHKTYSFLIYLMITVCYSSSYNKNWISPPIDAGLDHLHTVFFWIEKIFQFLVIDKIFLD